MSPERRPRQIITIDCAYLHPRFAAAYLLIDGPHAAFIDNNTSHSVPLLMKALSDHGLTPESVDWVIITHVHLDHAGGTSALMKKCPHARLLAHPRAVKHLVDPTKLVGSARAVYGAEAFEKLYGQIDPIDASRVRAVEDEERIPFGTGAPLRFFHTRGHANHHFCIEEPETRSVFTGDAFGLAYPALQPPQGLFIFPSTSPTDFIASEALLSLDRILATQAERAYLTHFGAVTELPAAAAQLRALLIQSEELLQEATESTLSNDDLEPFLLSRLRLALEAAAIRQGMRLGPAEGELLRLDLELNAQGLAYVAKKRRTG